MIDLLVVFRRVTLGVYLLRLTVLVGFRFW